MNNIEEYIIKRFPKRFKNKPVLIKEFNTHYEVKQGCKPYYIK